MPPKARHVGTVCGSRVTRFPVVVERNTIGRAYPGASLEIDKYRAEFSVLARDAREAADLVYRDYATAELTHITVYGPRGGEAAYRFIGWESAVANSIAAAHDAARAAERQPFLPL